MRTKKPSRSHWLRVPDPGSRLCLLSTYLLALAVTALPAFQAPLEAAADEQVVARRILQTAGVQGGLVVHLGCGDGRLTAALHAGDRYLVQGIDVDAASVQRARGHVHALGLAGSVSVDTFDGQSLPYADNLVNLVVISDRSSVTDEEIRRVLCPRGTALTVTKGEGPSVLRQFVKPWPEDIDEWTHFLHDPSNNAVAHDRVVGAPGHLQWTGGPLWSRSHEYDSSLCAMVSARGRLFYIFDEGPTGIVDPRIPDRWTASCAAASL